MSNRKLAILFIILSALSVGGTTTFGKFVLTIIPKIPFTFFRFLIGSIILTPFFLKDKNNWQRPSMLVCLLCLIQVVNTTVYPFGLRLTTATISQTLFSAAPIITALFALWIIKEKFTSLKVGGVIVGFVGALLIIFLPILQSHSRFSGTVPGNLLVFVSVSCLAIYSVVSKNFLKKYTPLYLTTLFVYQTTIVTFFLSLSYFLSHPHFVEVVPLVSWGAMIYVGIFGTLFFLFYQYAVKYGSPTIASTINYLSPIAAFSFAFVVLGERVTLGFLIGALLALIGVFLVNVPLTYLKSFRLQKI